MHVEAHLVRFADGAVTRHRAWAFARALLAQSLDDLSIVRDADGKPRLARGDLELSLSHAGAWVAVALSADGPVGIDVEPLRPLAGTHEIAAEFFPASARADFAAASPAEQLRVFLRWWTRIEAAVKASGRGLDDARDCLAGASYESCELIPNVEAAVATHARGPMTVRWHIHHCV